MIKEKKKTTVADSLLIKEWNYEKNLGLDPNSITLGMHIKAWWICGKGHEWEAATYSRKTKGCPYCSGRKTTKENSLSVTHPDLAKQWHPTKNGELIPDNFSAGSHKKVWWLCIDCDSDYDTIISNRARLGVGCGFCKGKKSNDTNSLFQLNPDLASQWHPIKNNKLTPNDITPTSGKIVWWLGGCGHEWRANISSRNRGNGCPICNGKQILIGFNDMWTTNPELASMLLNPEDGYKYTQASGKKVDWECSDCSQINKNKTIGKVMENSLCCNYCSDGFKYPEKFLMNFLMQLDEDFTAQKEFEWLKNRKYDFYIPSLNVIIQTHGGQHYMETGFSSLGGRTFKEEQENDTLKETSAKENGITNYIILDCRKSSAEYIKNSIVSSKLMEYYDVSDINWNIISKNANNSKLVESCIFYSHTKDELSLAEMAKKLSIHVTTLTQYLRKGREINLCDYKPQDKKKKDYEKNIV